MPDTISFQWHHEWITDRLTMAVGAVILKWAMMDEDLTRMCQTFWFDDHPEERMPRSFDKRTRNLVESVAKRYSDEHGEFRQFAWFIQRLRIASSKRDDLAHGLPGKVTVDGREFEGLYVPFPSRMPRGVPMTVFDIENFHRNELYALHVEMGNVSSTLSKVREYASYDKFDPPTLGGLIPAKKDRQRPKLPRWNLPPPTFRA
jgi:hypothetical protein